MLHTLFGDIVITVNQEYYEYLPIELSNIGKHFTVDKRYQITVNSIDAKNQDVTICCHIENHNDSTFESGPDSGERLALISFYNENQIMSIGTLGDIDGINYRYLPEGMSMVITKGSQIKSVVFIITWLETNDIECNNNTWFAGDPDEY